MNSFGKNFIITTFGESHGPAIGVVIDGCPAGLEIDTAFIQKELNRRKPGQSAIVSQRNEDDIFEIISGVFQGKSTGTPITIIIRNKDQKSKDYDHLTGKFRPSHADYTYFKKYGHRDHRGGGRASARETASRVAAGAIAKLLLRREGITVQAYTGQVGDIRLGKNYTELDLNQTESNVVRCPDPQTAKKMIKFIESVKREGDTVGGVVTCVIKGVPAGLGAPVYDKLSANLAEAMLSINAAKGFEYGSGFAGAAMRGSEHNDIFYNDKGVIKTKTNYSGGIQGGISNGMDIYFNVAFKPVATILREQITVDENGKEVIIKGKGRHDPCVVPRAVPVVEAMAAIVIAGKLHGATSGRLSD